MNPIGLIKRDLGSVEWERCRKSWAEESIISYQTELVIFRDYKIFLVHGQTQQFDFPTLPHGSYGYYAANGREAVRLTRVGREIETILAADWSSLPEQNPVKLTSFIIGFYDDGIKASHRVLADADELRNMTGPLSEYRINESDFARVLPNIGKTYSKVEADTIQLRAITLRGWMHYKRNLGIETIAIAKNGKVELGKREVLAENIFDEVPGIRY
jgi:hypothetical protein